MRYRRIIFSVLMMTTTLSFVISNVTVADQGAPIRSEQGALNALNQTFGSGFVSNPGPGPGYTVIGGDQSPAEMLNHDTFADRIGDNSPFQSTNGYGPGRIPGWLPSDAPGTREIHNNVASTMKVNGISDQADLSGAEQQFEAIFGARPVRVPNDSAY